MPRLPERREVEEPETVETTDLNTEARRPRSYTEVDQLRRILPVRRWVSLWLRGSVLKSVPSLASVI